MPFGFRRRAKTGPAALVRPVGVGRGAWQQHLRDPAAPLTEAVPGLSEYAASAGWTVVSGQPPLDDFEATFAHDALLALHGVHRDLDPRSAPGGGPNRYADTVTGTADDREFLLSNVSFTWSFLHGGEHPVAGSVCALKLGFLLPLLLVNPAGTEPFMRAMTKPVKVGRSDVDARFSMRSGHADYAAELLNAFADALVATENCSFLLEFGSLVSLSSSPFETVEQMRDRLLLMSRLASMIPVAVRSKYEVKVPVAQPGSEPLPPQDQERARRIVDALPADERRQLIARMRSEGPDAVISELLADPRWHDK